VSEGLPMPSKKELEEKVKELENKLEDSQKEFDEISMDLSLAVSEFFLAMQNLNQGDFTVRAPEDSSIELLANFGKIINITIETLGKKTKEIEEANLTIKEQAARELELSQRTIERQQAAISELTTPIIRVWDKVLCLPIVGIVDSRRSVEMMDSLLNRIIETECRCVIVDITGVDVVDTKTADYFVKMIKAANLLGTTCIITGISPEIAQTLTNIGVDLSGIKTLRNLKEGLAESFRMLGIKVGHD